LDMPAQEVQADEEAGEELQECPDHHPSSFERGKPQSISLPTICKSLNIASFMIDALRYRSCSQPLLHIFLVYLNILHPCYPASLGPR
jgi:hypothetical protein